MYISQKKAGTGMLISKQLSESNTGFSCYSHRYPYQQLPFDRSLRSSFNVTTKSVPASPGCAITRCCKLTSTYYSSIDRNMLKLRHNPTLFPCKKRGGGELSNTHAQDYHSQKGLPAQMASEAGFGEGPHGSRGDEGNLLCLDYLCKQRGLPFRYVTGRRAYTTSPQ